MNLILLALGGLGAWLFYKKTTEREQPFLTPTGEVYKPSEMKSTISLSPTKSGAVTVQLKPIVKKGISITPQPIEVDIYGKVTKVSKYFKKDIPASTKKV